MISDVSQKQTDIGGGNGEQETVGPVEHTAVAGYEIAEVLHTDHTLEQRFREVADLARAGGNKRRAYAQPKRHGTVISENKIYDYTDRDRRERTAYAALDGLVGTDERSDLVLAEPFAAEHGEAVAHPGGKAREHKRRHPDTADGNDHQYTEKNAGIGQAGEGEERAASGNALVYHTGKEREINAENEQERVGEQTKVKKTGHFLNNNERSLYCKVDEHYPQSTAGLELFDVLAEFIGTQTAGNGKIKNAGDGGYEHACQRYDYQDSRGNYSGLQLQVLSLIYDCLYYKIRRVKKS